MAAGRRGRTSLRRQLDAHRDLVLVVAAMHRGHVSPERPRRTTSTMSPAPRPARRLGLDRRAAGSRRVLVDRVVDADDVGVLEGRAPASRPPPWPSVGDRRSRPRSATAPAAGRHLDHLGVAAVAAADRGDSVAHRTAISWLWRSRVCLSTRLTWMSPCSGRAQVVLAHQAVEVDRLAAVPA